LADINNNDFKKKISNNVQTRASATSKSVLKNLHI